MNTFQNFIKVLALDDDNHEVCFITENEYFSTAAEFMKAKLLKPHAEEYQIRSVALCSPPKSLEEIPEDEFNHMFIMLTDEYHPQGLDGKRQAERIKVFNTFWNNGEEFWYV